MLHFGANLATGPASGRTSPPHHISRASLPACLRPHTRFAGPGRVSPPRPARAPLRVASVAEFTRSSAPPVPEAILCAKIAAHSASVAAALVLEDSESATKVITTSLDKTVALWTAEGGCELSVNSGYAEAQKFAVPGGPAFCTLLDRRSEDGLNDQVYLGTHGKSVMAWVPPAAAPEPGVALADHCGWVRALAVSGAGRWLFSAACKEIRQWDNARTVPSAAGTTTVEKGDVLAMVAGKDRLYTAGADGSVRSFVFGKKAGLTPAACRPKAHGDRVCALALGPGLLYSASYDGSIKAWDLETLEIVAVAQAAHSGERVASLALGPGGGVLYSGGGDCMVRRWHPGLLSEAAPPLHAHHHPVGVVAAGPRGVLVSGDAGGEVAVWRMSGAGDCKATGDSGCNNNFLSY